MKAVWFISWLLVMCMGSSALAQSSQALTLTEALRTARAQAPELAQARAQTQGARARVDSARAPLLPQVDASVGYQLGTSNVPGPAPQSFRMDDSYSVGVSASQLIYDFGQTRSALDAAKARAAAELHGEASAQLQLALAVRVAFYGAGAAKSMAAVARETLGNEEKHLAQVQAFVDVGARPAIDLAQARAAVASARLAVVRADNAYQTAKASLSRAMGVSMAFEVNDELPAAVPGEDTALPALTQEAEKTRPELSALATETRAQELSIEATEGAYGPTLGASTGMTESGRKLDELAWNWNVGLSLRWPLFQGGVTGARVREGRATLAGLRAQQAVMQKEIRFALEEAQTNVHGARAAVLAADEVVAATKERLVLAEGRYAAGVGNIIELGDAQLAVRDAQGQRVQADYDLATARARLLFALGRE